MDDEYERNLIIRLAKGEIKEEDLDEPLTEEQKEDLEFEREMIEIREKNGFGELNDALSTDDE